MKNYVLGDNFPTNQEQLQKHIEMIFNDSATLHKITRAGKNIYYHAKTNTIVLFHPYGQGKRGDVFQPLYGLKYYEMAV